MHGSCLNIECGLFCVLRKHSPKIHIVGSGFELDNVKKLARELKTDNVVFYGQRPLEEMPRLYKIADVMLIVLEDKPYVNMTIPGKVQSCMAVGKPIVGAINGSCMNFIRNNDTGYCCNSGDSKSLANIIKNLDVAELRKNGNHSKEVYLSKYKKSYFIDKLISELGSIVK